MARQNLERIAKEVSSIQTANGSVYRYLPDGSTQRYSPSQNRTFSPQDVLVFIPDYNTILTVAPRHILDSNVLGENEIQFEQTILSYSQENGKTCRVIDKDGNILHKNEEVNKEDRVYLAFIDKTKNRLDFTLPVSKIPKIGYYTFDAGKSFEDGQFFRDRHIGNKVTKIIYLSGEVEQ